MQEEFLSEEYTNWLNNLFSNTTNDVFNKDERQKFNILFKYIAEYLNSEFAPSDVKDYYLNTRYLTYDFTYNNKDIEIKILQGVDLRRHKLEITGYHILKVEDKTKLNVPFIDLNKVIEYVLINSKKEEDRALYTIIKTVNKLENEGIKREVLINDLQIAYAYEVNKDTKEKYNKGR